MPPIPDLEYVTDLVAGTLIERASGSLIEIGEGPSRSARETFAIRYAIPMLAPPTQAVIPGLFFGERGGALVGREAWDYMQDRFQMHPRADVVGLYLDGSRAEVWIRDLDFGAKVRAFAYQSAEDKVPRAELFGYVTTDEVLVPSLLRRYLPRIESGDATG